MSQNKVSEKVQEAIFNKLLSSAANNECADCKNKSPSWVSLDYGVYVCIRCSGVHRQLGPHITRVRSTRLDGWVQDNIDIMAATGNEIANAFYENKMTNPNKRPGPNTSMEDCRRFIDAKYIKKQWAPDGYQEPVKEFLKCVKTGGQPDFGYATGIQREQPVHDAHANNADMKVIRKRSLSLENKQKANNHQHHDLLTADHDLLGGSGHGSQNDFGDFKSAHAHSASPAGKNASHEVKQDGGWNWDLANASHGTNQGANNNNNASNNLTNLYGNNNNMQGQGNQQQQQQTQQKNMDLMKLYGQANQPTVHQNHFMGMGQNQGWGQPQGQVPMQGHGHGHGHGNSGWNNNMGMQGGLQGGFTGSTNQNMRQQGTFQNNFGGHPGFQQQNMGFNQQTQQTGFGGMGGSNTGMGFNQAQPNANQFGGNQFQQNNNPAFGWK